MTPSSPFVVPATVAQHRFRMVPLAADPAVITPHAGSLQLVTAAVPGVAVIVALITWLRRPSLVTVGRGSGMNGRAVAASLEQSLPPIVGMLLGWLVAANIRLATGSATVATITASGVLAALAATLPTGETSLLVLAIGAGSVFFSHVNDAGSWLVKEYFGLDIVQNLKTWSAMETLISVVGLALVLALGIVVWTRCTRS